MKNENFFILPINKPKSISSFKALNLVKKTYNFNKRFHLGHTGTLDPFATGILILLGGKATKLAKFFNLFEKTYFAKVIFGKKSETGDSYGKIVKESIIPDKDQILLSLNKFKGEILQKPHKFSAVKINGKRAYQYSRDNIDIELKPRKITIFDLNMLLYNKNTGVGIFKIVCSSGTYIRSLFEDIAETLNTYAYTGELVRFSIGPFKIQNTLKFNIKNNLNDNSYFNKNIILNKENLEDYLIYPTYEIFKQYFPFFKIPEKLKTIFINGKKIQIDNLLDSINLNKTTNQNHINSKYIGFYNKDKLITTILEFEDDKVNYSFNYPEIIKL